MEAYFYGATGQKLETYNCSIPPGESNYICGLEGTNTYFAGKMLSEKGVFLSTDRLGSVRADSNGTTMSYFPWGEERGAGTTNGRTKFAGYYRDAVGQDYAMARYYNSNSGAFWSPDPVNGGETGNPLSTNLYQYALGDPINSNDPTGLVSTPTCGQTSMVDTTFGGGSLGSLSSLINGTSNLGILAEAVFAESSTNAANTDEKLAIADVILNRFMIVDGYDNIVVNGAVWGAAGPGYQGFGWANGSLAGIVGYPGQFATFQTTTATQTSATLVGGAQTNLTTALNSSATSATCADLENSFWSAYIADSQMVFSDFQLFGDANFVPTSFNSLKSPKKSLYFEGNTPVNFGTANQFYRVSWDMVQYNDGLQSPAYSPNPPRPIRRGPPRPGGPQ